MTNEEAIKFLQQIYPNGGHCWLDEQRIEAIDMAIKALKEWTTNNNGSCGVELEEAVDKYISHLHPSIKNICGNCFIDGVLWKEQQLMKNVTECKVFIPYNAKKYLVIDQNLISDKKLGDKVKVVVIKED